MQVLSAEELPVLHVGGQGAEEAFVVLESVDLELISVQQHLGHEAEDAEIDISAAETVPHLQAEGM